MHGKRGSILLCLANLPEQVTCKEIRFFVQKAVDNIAGSRLLRAHTVSQCSILRLTDIRSGRTSHQGLIGIQPAKMALQAIPVLEQIPFRGAQLQVRRYRHSSVQVASPRTLTTISDLLSVDPQNVDADRYVKIDLVTSTGIRAKTLPQTAPEREDAGFFVHGSGNA